MVKTFSGALLCTVLSLEFLWCHRLQIAITNADSHNEDDLRPANMSGIIIKADLMCTVGRILAAWTNLISGAQHSATELRDDLRAPLDFTAEQNPRIQPGRRMTAGGRRRCCAI